MIRGMRAKVAGALRIVGALLLMFAMWIPIEQALVWLREGQFPPRDLYWFFAPVSCDATEGLAQGFQGMTACRPDYLHVTTWVGLDRIANWALDLHLSLYLVLGAFLTIALAAVLDLDAL